jgi:transketolase
MFIGQAKPAARFSDDVGDGANVGAIAEFTASRAFDAVVVRDGDAAAIALWTRYVDFEADVVGLEGFGHSTPGEVVYEKMGITAEALVARARKKLVI